MDILDNDLLWIAGVLVALGIIYFLTRRHQHQQDAHQDKEPYQQVINDSNYNIGNTGINGEDYAHLSPEEARRVRDQWEQDGYMPSEEEFYRVKRAMEGKAGKI